MKAYPKRFMSVLLGVLSLVLLSGLLLLPTTLALRLDVGVPWALPGGARVYVAALHATGCLLGLFMLGALWTVHMRSGWRRHLQRGSGAALVLALVALVLSAIGVYYLGDEAWAMAAAVIHIVVGLLAVGVLVWHGVAGRRVRRQRLHRKG
jgi:hypothetical protein